jgi:ATP-dependent Lon protease
MINDLKERALETLRYMNIELQKLELKTISNRKVRFDLDQQQREYFLHQQMKTSRKSWVVYTEEEIDEMLLRPSLRNGMIKPKNISKRMSKMRE